MGLQSCMLVDGEFFYDSIEGFEYEAGYNYRLRIGKYDPLGRERAAAGRRPVCLSFAGAAGEDPGAFHGGYLVSSPARVVCARSDDYCMVVDGAPYDDHITGFDYEAGYHYVLEANRYADGRYVLDEVVSKTRAAGTEEEITIDRHRVRCDDGYPGFCKVFNGAPYRGEIVGFQPLHDYDYRLRVEKFSMFPDGMPGSPTVPAYGYRWLETIEEMHAE